MKKLTLALALGLASASPLFAEDATLFAQVGAWDVTVHKKECSTVTTLSDGTILRIGLSDKGKKGYVQTFNPAWDEFKKRHKYPVSYDLDGTIFEVEGKGIEKDGIPGAEVRFEDPLLLVDLAQKHMLTFSVEGKEVSKIDLTGSGDAVKQMLACQEAQ